MQSERLLRSHGLRVTRQRLAVLDVLQEGGHPEVDEIITRARRRVSSLSTQAAYDVLNALTDAGLARRLEPAGSNTRYEAGGDDSHHHLVCRRCGEVCDVDVADAETPCLEPALAKGFHVEEAEVTYWGLCPECQTSSVLGPVWSVTAGLRRARFAATRHPRQDLARSHPWNPVGPALVPAGT